MLQRFVIIPLAILGLAAGARAGTLTSATWFQATEPGLYAVPSVPMTRTGGQLGATGSSTSVSIGVSLSYPAFQTTVFVPKTPNAIWDLAIQLTQAGAQAITATANGATGAPGIPGTVVFMTALHEAAGVNASMFKVGAATLLKVPLSNGAAGQFTSTFVVAGIPHVMTVDFYGWTPGAVSFTGLSSLYQALPNETAMGSFNLTGSGGGTVTLVSPSKVSIDGPAWQRRTASITKLVLTFVPEPGTLLLLGAAGVALLLGGRRRS
jgi:hypothetical protein